jgi:hypothetical protein
MIAHSKKKTQGSGRRAVLRLIKANIGAPGLAWGSAPGGGMTAVIHDGNGAAGQFSGLVFNSEQLRDFADKFVSSLTNAEHVPAIRDLIDAALARQRRELIKPVLSHLCEQRATLTPAHALPPYNPRTAIVAVPSAALVVRGERAA